MATKKPATAAKPAGRAKPRPAGKEPAAGTPTGGAKPRPGKTKTAAAWDPGRAERIARGQEVRRAVQARVDAVIAGRVTDVTQAQQVHPATEAKYLDEAVRAYAAEHGLPPDAVRVDAKLARLAARVDDGDGDPAGDPVASGRLNLTEKLVDKLLAIRDNAELAEEVTRLLAGQV